MYTTMGSSNMARDDCINVCTTDAEIQSPHVWFRNKNY